MSRTDDERYAMHLRTGCSRTWFHDGPCAPDELLARQASTSIDQPPPIPNDFVTVWGLVVDDMQERNLVGTVRYGTPLQPFNGRDALKDAYAEALDLVVYLRQAIYERDGR